MTTYLYPDTTRSLRVATEATENVEGSNYHFVHTINEIGHTLNNAIIIIEENSGTRMKDNGTARGRRGSQLHVQTNLRLDEAGIWFDSAIGVGTTTTLQDTTTQTITMVGVPTGGTFLLLYEGEATAPLAYNIDGPALQTALRLLTDPDITGITASGSAGGPWTINFPSLVPGILGPELFTSDPTALVGGTTPHLTVAGAAVTGNYQRKWAAGSARGVSLSLIWFNGLRWQKMKGARVNTMNAQFFGNALATLDMQIIGRAAVPIDPPSPIAEDNTYVPMDAPMQAVRFAGLLNADTDKMAININNNLTQRSPMDGSTSQGRTRFGNLQIDLDGMVDYPAYTGSLYESFYLNTPPSSMDVVAIDDLHTIHATPTVHPGIMATVTKPLLIDGTAEGLDNQELVQVVKGRAQYDPVTAAGLTVVTVTDKNDAFYAGT